MAKYIKIYVTSSGGAELTGYRLIDIDNIKDIVQVDTTTCVVQYADPGGAGAVDRVELTMAAIAANSPKLVDNIVATIETALGQIYPIPVVDLTGIGAAGADITITAYEYKT